MQRALGCRQDGAGCCTGLKDAGRGRRAVAIEAGICMSSSWRKVMAVGVCRMARTARCVVWNGKLE